jgi:hypothetical protein
VFPSPARNDACFEVFAFASRTARQHRYFGIHGSCGQDKAKLFSYPLNRFAPGAMDTGRARVCRPEACFNDQINATRPLQLGVSATGDERSEGLASARQEVLHEQHGMAQPWMTMSPAMPCVGVGPAWWHHFGKLLRVTGATVLCSGMITVAATYVAQRWRRAARARATASGST